VARLPDARCGSEVHHNITYHKHLVLQDHDRQFPGAMSTNQIIDPRPHVAFSPVCRPPRLSIMDDIVALNST
jgi:hypothetical protein